MTDEATAAPVADGELVTLATVAARNIAAALKVSSVHVPEIEQAIRDEIDVMSTHFALAFADVQQGAEEARATLAKEYYRQLDEVKSVFSFVEENTWGVLLVACVVFVFGVITGRVV